MPYNHAMSHLDILLPFGLAPTEMAKDLLAQLQAPSLAMLLGRSSRKSQVRSDPYARSLPHEQWLSSRHGTGDAVESSPPLARALMESFGHSPGPGTWFVLQPAHLHVARDHLVLTDLQQLSLDESESRMLFDAALPLFEENGLKLLYGDARHWFVRANDWLGLRTSTPEAATGHNIDIWLPKGDQERAWRRLHNEVQMTWHMHSVNAERAARRANPVNALWLWGGDAAGLPSNRHDISLSLPDARHLFARVNQRTLQEGRLEPWPSLQSAQASVVLDSLTAAALVQDWGDWLNRYQVLERDIFTPLLAGLKAGTIDSASLIVTDSTDLNEFVVSRNALRKFWIRPSLTPLSR